MKTTKINRYIFVHYIRNSRINTNRVVVENTTRKIKIFKVMAEKYRNRRKRFTHKLNLITAIMNYDRNLLLLYL